MQAAYLVDTSVCVELLRKRSDQALNGLIERLRRDGCAVSVITVGEVTDGILSSLQRELNRQRWLDLLEVFDIIDVNRDIAEIWAEVRGTLRRAGQTVPDNDLLIAATGLLFGLTVVTLNERHFSRVSGLSVLVPST